jgi:hypothetical protein
MRSIAAGIARGPKQSRASRWRRFFRKLFYRRRVPPLGTYSYGVAAVETLPQTALCARQYRVWKAPEFVYGDCPYRGPRMFNDQGWPISHPASDVCGKTPFDCSKRGCLSSFLGFPEVST